MSGYIYGSVYIASLATLDFLLPWISLAHNSEANRPYLCPWVEKRINYTASLLCFESLNIYLKFISEIRFMNL